MGPFLCGVETAKRFVNIRLHCIVSNLKRIRKRKMSTLPPWKKFPWRPWSARGVTRGERGAHFPGPRITMGAPNDCGVGRKVPTMSQVLLQCNTFASKRPQFRTWGRQTCFLPREPFNLVAPPWSASYYLRFSNW